MMRTRRAVVGLSAAALLLTGLAGAGPVRAVDGIRTQGCVQSVPEPDTTTPVNICYTLYRPPAASAANTVPVIFHSHGWGGSRTNSATAFGAWMDAGFGVLSFDQRGFGESNGGKAHVENPEFEGQDVQALVDMLAETDWVTQDGPGDPRIGAIGGSYGGGYQFVGAFTDLMERGPALGTRFDALAPEITWWDLKESLAPAEVPRTLWNTALFAAGTTAHTDTVIKGFAYGAATGMWPHGEVPGVDLDAFFLKNGPAWHVSQGRKLDIPVLFGQGITDNLFNLNQGLKNFGNALTPAAQARSIFVGYNGGHVLPAVLPTGSGTSGDPCSKALGGGSFSSLSIRFFKEALLGEATGLSGHGQYHLAADDGAKCLTVDSVATDSTVDVGTVATNTGPGVPQQIKLADGPITIAGTPYVDASVTALGVQNKAFFALAVGTNAVDAKIVQGNMLPINELLPVVAAARTIELPAVAVEVPAGKSLFLTVSPFSDMSFGHSTRVPGAMVLQNTKVRLPVV
jgi:pimeloyl-ACP methyl ester carboxylesterase